jgi:hypothetical protein
MQTAIRRELASSDSTHCSDTPRIGLAKLAKMAFDGSDLRPLWHELMAKVTAGEATAEDAMDLSLIAQLLGDKQAGLTIQSVVLARHQLFKSPCSTDTPRLRVLALATPMDMGGNTPIEFLLEESDIELMTLYVMPDVPLPEPLPDHDVAIVISSDSDGCRDALLEIARLSLYWPRPIVNAPGRICNLDRDKLCHLLSGIPGLAIPVTTRVARSQLADIAQSAAPLGNIADGLMFPIMVRPTGSHAGYGLSKIDDVPAIERYLADRPEQEFFVARFIDYASNDGLFRKYRVTVVDGRPYACHMGILDQWNIWYLNAEMEADAAKRAEEEEFIKNFDTKFAARHGSAFAEMIARVGLEYFTIDCAETKSGDLLIFEVDNTGIVHNMDSPEVFPYRPPQMRKIFEAFAGMLIKAGTRHAES